MTEWHLTYLSTKSRESEPCQSCEIESPEKQKAMTSERGSEDGIGPGSRLAAIASYAWLLGDTIRQWRQNTKKNTKSGEIEK